MEKSASILKFIQSVSRLDKKVSRIRSLYMKDLGLMGADMSVFLVLNTCPEGMRMDQLVEETQTDKAQVSRSLKALAEKGLVDRPKQKTYRGVYCLSEKGAQVANLLEEHAARVFEEAHGSIERQQDWEQFYAFLDQMESHLDQEIERMSHRTQKSKSE